HMGAPADALLSPAAAPGSPFFQAAPLTAYNAITPVETAATVSLLHLLRGRPGGARLEQVMWAASGSEAVQKALWAALARDRTRDVILATRHGFHGKKGLAGAVTGSEADPDPGPRVRLLSLPAAACARGPPRRPPVGP